MQGTADLHQAFTDSRLAEAARIVDEVSAFDAAVDILDGHTTAGDTPRLAIFSARERARPHGFRLGITPMPLARTLVL
jgi:hypothetical protein